MPESQIFTTEDAAKDYRLHDPTIPNERVASVIGLECGSGLGGFGNGYHPAYFFFLDGSPKPAGCRRPGGVVRIYTHFVSAQASILKIATQILPSAPSKNAVRPKETSDMVGNRRSRRP